MKQRKTIDNENQAIIHKKKTQHSKDVIEKIVQVSLIQTLKNLVLRDSSDKLN